MTLPSEQASRDTLPRLLAGIVRASAEQHSSLQGFAVVREIFAAFFFLRWLDIAEAEEEDIAVFEGRPYNPQLPPALQWHRLATEPDAQVLTKQLAALASHIPQTDRDRDRDRGRVGSWLRRLTGPLRDALRLDTDLLFDLLHWINDLPFETPGERREVLDLFDEVLEETAPPSAGQYQTPANIARLVAALAQPRPGERVYDPCFGSGNFLIAAWQQAERSRRDRPSQGWMLDVAGVEINDGAFLIGLTRMLLAGIEHPQLELGDSLEREAPGSPSREGFDIVLANPPIGAKPARTAAGHRHYAFLTSDTAGLFIQHALAQLRQNGRAVIAVPEGFLFRAGPDRDLRRHLLQQGQVEAVVGLPAGAFAPYTNVRGALLLLRPHTGSSRVRMVDAAPFFETRKGRRKIPHIHLAMAEQLAAELRRPELRARQDLPAGVPEGTPGTGRMTRAIREVTLDELANSDWDLTPRQRDSGGLEQLLASLRQALGENAAIVPLSSVARVLPGRAIKAADMLDEAPVERDIPVTGYIRIRDLNHQNVGHPSSWLRPGVALVERRWALLPGDVLASRSGTIGKTALVRNGAAGAIAGNGLFVLRASQERLDPGFLLAYLAHPACQNWLAARARGAVIRHLSRSALEELPVPLPPLWQQGWAAAQFRDNNVDVLTCLGWASPDAQQERLLGWLAEFSSRLPANAPGVDRTAPIGALDSLVPIAVSPRLWLEREDVPLAAARWLRPLVETVRLFDGITRIPPGPGLLNVLQDAERGVRTVIEQADGPLATETQVRILAERLRDWLRALIDDLASRAELRVTQTPEGLHAGRFEEFSVVLTNVSALPLRSVVVEAIPEWGQAQISYLPEQGTLAVSLAGEIPKVDQLFLFHLRWRARTLVGPEIEGTVEVVVPILAAGTSLDPSLQQALGPNPYVTGSPLAPGQGQSVFFGREELIDRIRRQVSQHGNVVLLEGNRRSGKTSVLHHLEGPAVIPGWLAVRASLQDAEGSPAAVGVPTAEVFRLMARNIIMAINQLGVPMILPNGEPLPAGKPPLGLIRKVCQQGIGGEAPFGAFRDWLEQVLAELAPQGLRLLLMLDEFDKLQEGIDNGVTSPQVPENIRFLIQEFDGFSAILTGSRRLKRLREQYWSALYGLGTTMTVTALDIDNARRVVTEPVHGRLAYSSEAVERIIRLTACQPYLLQYLCNQIFDHAAGTGLRSITLSTVDAVASVMVRDNEHFASLWEYAAAGPDTGGCRRQLILVDCAMSLKQDTHLGFATLREQLTQAGIEVEEPSLALDLEYLRELELLQLSGEMGDGRYSLAIPLMAQWMEQHQDAAVVASRARTEAEEEHA